MLLLIEPDQISILSTNCRISWPRPSFGYGRNLHFCFGTGSYGNNDDGGSSVIANAFGVSSGGSGGGSGGRGSGGCACGGGDGGVVDVIVDVGGDILVLDTIILCHIE